MILSPSSSAESATISCWFRWFQGLLMGVVDASPDTYHGFAVRYSSEWYMAVKDYSHTCWYLLLLLKLAATQLDVVSDEGYWCTYGVFGEAILMRISDEAFLMKVYSDGFLVTGDALRMRRSDDGLSVPDAGLLMPSLLMRVADTGFLYVADVGVAGARLRGCWCGNGFAGAELLMSGSLVRSC
ncbi:hypothetical protein Tco_0255698 [Tanacetum coccineum]